MNKVSGLFLGGRKGIHMTNNFPNFLRLYESVIKSTNVLLEGQELSFSKFRAKAQRVCVWMIYRSTFYKLITLKQDIT